MHNSGIAENGSVLNGESAEPRPELICMACTEAGRMRMTRAWGGGGPGQGCPGMVNSDGGPGVGGAGHVQREGAMGDQYCR